MSADKCKAQGKHTDPVSLSRSQKDGGHFWICLGCRKQLSGNKITDPEELEAYIIIAETLREHFAEKKNKDAKPN
jgi:hypothetical protein